MNLSVDNLIPHRPPMRFIQTLMESSATTARATACFAPDDFAVVNGFVSEAALVECVAQTVAAALGHAAQGNGQPAMGMLAAVNDFQIHSRPAAGQTLEIETREIKRLGPMRLMAATITCENRTLASGELTLYA